MRMIGKIRLTVAVLCLACQVPGSIANSQAINPPAEKIRFQSQIDAFLREDSTSPPPKGAILFIGSSIFRQWIHLKEQMAPLPAFNRAFGGSRTAEVLYFMDKIVLPYEPRIIVYYCGSNDINASEKPTDIFGRFKQFCEKVSARLPATRIFFVSINRAPQKKNRWGAVDSTNAFVREYCMGSEKRGYIDVNPVLFDKHMNPRLELYREDLLHFKDSAYVEFAGVIKPVIEKAWKGVPQ
jgi:hypothetical protein